MEESLTTAILPAPLSSQGYRVKAEHDPWSEGFTQLKSLPTGPLASVHLSVLLLPPSLSTLLFAPLLPSNAPFSPNPHPSGHQSETVKESGRGNWSLPSGSLRSELR